jgi:hypothetical protein
VENATVGVSVGCGGGSGVGVSVAGSGVAVNDAAVSVNSATTVYAAEVRTASTSGVGTMGVAGAQAARIKVAITAKMMNFVFMGPLLIYVSSYIKRPAGFKYRYKSGDA